MTTLKKKNSKYVTMNKSVLFHLRSVAKIHQGFQTPRNNKKHSACGRAFICFSVLATLMKQSHSFLIYYCISMRRFLSNVLEEGKLQRQKLSILICIPAQ